jgi:pimeloyl-ACP methyl ester carboxylesterase
MKRNTPPYEVQAGKTLLFFLVCLIVLFAAEIIASLVQKDFGRVAVRNVTYPNYNGIRIRAKLFWPAEAFPGTLLPGIVYIHGYQNNRETSDAYCLELGRRGFVVLNIDAIGRGNSGLPGDPQGPDFDPTYGGRSSLDYLRALPGVNPQAIGLMGHSLGAETAYRIALKDPAVKALAFSGFAYTLEATPDNPRNMLMIIGQYDEFRRRMTGVGNIEKEWMSAPQSKRAFPVPDPRLGTTYGDFVQGTARRVFVPRITHIHESHHRDSIAEALDWMRQALRPDPRFWIDSQKQTWPIKEWATFLALAAGFSALLPLGALMLRTRIFSPLKSAPAGDHVCSWKSFLLLAGLNGLLEWLYLPLIFILFGIHVYLVKIDRAFPLMMANGVVWWFLWINLIGWVLFRLRLGRQGKDSDSPSTDPDRDFQREGFSLDGRRVGLTLLLAGLLFFFVYSCEHILEQIFLVDYRFLFPFASDLTRERAWMALVYFPFLLIGYGLLGLFIHGPLRLAPRKSGLNTFLVWSFFNLLALIVPLVIFLMVQYLPLFFTGYIPFVGPGGMFIPFVQALFHMIILLLITIPLSTWFFLLTGKIYLGAILNAALVAWMFASSQVIAPLPI